MSEVLIYIGKVLVIQAIFYAFYRFVLRNSVRHGWNRLFLLAALVVSFAIPFIEIPDQLPVQPLEESPVIVWMQESAVEFVMVPVPKESGEANFSMWYLLPWLYVLATVILIGRSIVYLFFIQKLKKHSEYVKKRWFKLFKTSQTRPFSFFSSVFIPKDVFGSDAFDQILAHECVHVKQRHSIDRLLMDLLVSLFWFNPFIYLYRNALIEIHEFQADEAVINQYNDPIGYQEVLYAQLQYATYSGLVSHFNFSMIKKRIVMMNKQKNKYAGLLYALTLPVLVSVIFAFSSKEAIEPIENVGNELAEILTPEPSFKLPTFNLPEPKAQLNKTEQDDNVPSIMPVKSQDLVRLTSGFGKRIHPVKKVEQWHLGVDFSCPIGSQILATANGVVESLQDKSEGYGKLIKIDHGNGYRTYYAQLSQFKVKEGDQVKKGEVIALSGNSGMSTAPHLHYEVKKGDKRVDPMDYIDDFKPKPVIKEIHSEKSKSQNESRVLEFIADNEGNGEATLRLHGYDKSPIIILQDKVVTNEDLWLLSPDDIKSVEILNANEAVNQYGEEGRNGVVILSIYPLKDELSAYWYEGKIYDHFDMHDETKNIEWVTKVEARYLESIKVPDGKKYVWIINDKELAMKAAQKYQEYEDRIWNEVRNDNRQEKNIKEAKEKQLIEDKIRKEKLKFEDSKQDRTLSIKGTGNDPLYVVDGKVVEEVTDLNPNNIDRINVLKGKDAKNKYGKKGKDGVVEITTKDKQKDKDKQKTKNKGKEKIKDNQQTYRVIIDPGHGGNDMGTKSELGILEKDINLEVARMVGEYFSDDSRIEIVFTRNNNEFIDLKSRSEATANSDLFISIHANFDEDDSKKFTGLYLNPNGIFYDESLKLAKYFKEEIEVNNREARMALSNVYLLKTAQCPAVHIELGYLSNTEDATFMNSYEGKKLLASSIAKGIKTSIQSL
ncbi:N-acetylmuramoyl-L-alanine amidase [Ekhidna sp.]|uniref:N-acetylmuramoyl-L-alanine amidase n=1 Tax=Ekhidna sp. TaxID=2608089 RepID=UPI003CCB74DA